MTDRETMQKGSRQPERETERAQARGNKCMTNRVRGSHVQHLTYKNGKMWANELAQLAQGGGGGQCRGKREGE